MGDKSIVLTMYGQDEQIDSVSISLFDRGNGCSYPYSSAIRYCNNINNLELAGNKWVYAAVIDENEKVVLKKPPRLFDMITRLNGGSLQRLLREVGRPVLARALKNAGMETKKKLFDNMSALAGVMLSEDIAGLRYISDEDIKAAQQNIIQTAQKLAHTGEIIF
ncbi:MAG: hypothetical protein LBD55_04110 [Treponema sp.]|jgi:hypothetical protein|nr:hypothetical protein [Treponema sp.]